MTRQEVRAAVLARYAAGDAPMAIAHALGVDHLSVINMVKYARRRGLVPLRRRPNKPKPQSQRRATAYDRIEEIRPLILAGWTRRQIGAHLGMNRGAVDSAVYKDQRAGKIPRDIRPAARAFAQAMHADRAEVRALVGDAAFAGVRFEDDPRAVAADRGGERLLRRGSAAEGMGASSMGWAA